MNNPRTPAFEHIRELFKPLTTRDVAIINEALDFIGFAKADEPEHRQINGSGLALIKRSEGLELKAYLDPVGVLTIGYGSTGPHVKPGMVITEAQAEELLKEDLARFEAAVDEMCKVATDNQFSAMTSLCFNIGEEHFRTSTLRRKHNEGDYAGAKAEFARWRFAGGRELPGLVKRRAAEAALYGSA